MPHWGRGPGQPRISCVLPGYYVWLAVLGHWSEEFFFVFLSFDYSSQRFTTLDTSGYIYCSIYSRLRVPSIFHKFFWIPKLLLSIFWFRTNSHYSQTQWEWNLIFSGFVGYTHNLGFKVFCLWTQYCQRKLTFPLHIWRILLI